VRNNRNLGALVHVGASEGYMENCTLQDNLIAAGVDSSSTLSLNDCSMKGNGHGAIWVGTHASEASVNLTGNKIRGRLWIGNKNSLKSVTEKGNELSDDSVNPGTEEPEEQVHVEAGAASSAGSHGSDGSAEEEEGDGARIGLDQQASAAESSCFNSPLDSPNVKRRLRLGTPRQLTTPATTPDPYFHPTTSSP
jgi:hypothetical protein